jgi:hypothetical protein
MGNIIMFSYDFPFLFFANHDLFIQEFKASVVGCY